MASYPINGDIASGKHRAINIDVNTAIRYCPCREIIRCGIDKAADWGTWCCGATKGVIQQDITG